MYACALSNYICSRLQVDRKIMLMLIYSLSLICIIHNNVLKYKTNKKHFFYAH